MAPNLCHLHSDILLALDTVVKYKPLNAYIDWGLNTSRGKQMLID